MKKLFLVIIVSLMSIVMSSCSQIGDISGGGGGGGSECKTEKHFPYLKSGNKWKYDYQLLLGDEGVMTIEIKKELRDALFKVELSIAGETDDAYWYGCKNYVSMMSNEDDNPEDTHSSKYKPKVGDSWVNINNGKKGTYVVVAIDEKVETKAGIFECVKIEHNFEGALNTDIIYESQEFGRIKYEGLLLSYELISLNFD